MFHDEDNLKIGNAHQDNFVKEETPEIYTSKDFDSRVQVNGKIKSRDLKYLNGTSENYPASNICDSSRHLSSSPQFYCDTIDRSDWSAGSSQQPVLMDLPEEILLYIAQFLDSYSLTHLSLTCSLFRDIARRLLRTKGVVIQQWERHEGDDKPKWRVAYHVSNYPSLILFFSRQKK